MKTYGIYVNSRENLLEQFPSIPIEFVQGIDTRKGQWKQFSEKICPKAFEKLKTSSATKKRDFHHDLTEGAVGCFLSHIRVYEKFLKETEDEYILVLEEDTILELQYNFENEKRTFPKHFDMIFLNYFLRGRCRHNQHFYVLREKGHFWMTNAYIISREGARKVLQHFEHNLIQIQFDSYLSLLHQQRVLSLYFTVFRYFPQKKSHKSTIQTSFVINPHCFTLQYI